jgi:hypothetical protein
MKSQSHLIWSTLNLWDINTYIKHIIKENQSTVMMHHCYLTVGMCRSML